MTETAEFLYKTTDFYAPSHEWTLKWDDPTIGIEWPIKSKPVLSAKDSQGLSLDEIKNIRINMHPQKILLTGINGQVRVRLIT